MKSRNGSAQAESKRDRLFTHRQSRSERYVMGKKLRDACPREAHAVWKAPAGRPDPVSLVLQADKGRVPELLPLRHGRMALSPFTFYRGSALNMAVDLATIPATGVRVQCCGDAMMVAIALCCDLLFGYSVQTPEGDRMLFLLLPLVISIAFFLIAEIDSPNTGVIQVTAQNLISLADSLRAP